jgi:SHS2 domain-containing protein
VRGSRGAPRHLVKGVTYSGLAFERKHDGYQARVVLDV